MASRFTTRVPSKPWHLAGMGNSSPAAPRTVRRGFWDPATGDLLCPPLRHQGIVHAVVFSPDGKLLATASADGTARLWTTTNPARGRPLPHQQIVNAVAFSPNGKLLATASNGGAVRLWDVASERPLGQNLRHQDDVLTVAFSPDGRLLASGTDDGTVKLWDPATGQSQGQLFHQPHGVQALAFSRDGKLLAAGLENGLLQFWNPITGQPHGKGFGKQDGLKSLALSPDGKLLATGSRSVARLWDADTGEPRGRPLTARRHDPRRGLHPGRQVAGRSPRKTALLNWWTWQPGSPMVRLCATRTRSGAWPLVRMRSCLLQDYGTIPCGSGT